MEILFVLIFLATVTATALFLYRFSYPKDRYLLDEPVIQPPRKVVPTSPPPSHTTTTTTTTTTTSFTVVAPTPPTPPNPLKRSKYKPTKTSRGKAYQELGHPSTWREESRRTAYLQSLPPEEASSLRGIDFEVPASFTYEDTSDFSGFSSPSEDTSSYDSGSGGSSGGGGSSYSYEPSPSSYYDSTPSYSSPSSSGSYDSGSSYSSSSSSSSYDSSSSSSSSYDSSSSSSSSSFDSGSSWLRVCKFHPKLP